MKINPAQASWTLRRRHGPRRQQDGMAVIVVLALLAIILVYVAGNIRSLYCLGAELKLVERLQKQRLQAAAAVAIARTNSTPQPAAGLPKPATTPNH